MLVVAVVVVVVVVVWGVVVVIVVMVLVGAEAAAVVVVVNSTSNISSIAIPFNSSPIRMKVCQSNGKFCPPCIASGVTGTRISCCLWLFRLELSLQNHRYSY